MLDMSCISRPNRRVPSEASDRPLGGSVTITQSSSAGACDVRSTRWASRRVGLVAPDNVEAVMYSIV